MASPLVPELRNPVSTHSQVSCPNSKPGCYLPHACSSLANHTNVDLVTHTAQCSLLHQPLSSNDAQTSMSATIEDVCPIILPSPPSLLLNAPNKITSAFLENATTINAQTPLNKPFYHFTPTSVSLPNINIFQFLSDPNVAKNLVTSLWTGKPTTSISQAHVPCFGPTLGSMPIAPPPHPSQNTNHSTVKLQAHTASPLYPSEVKKHNLKQNVSKLHKNSRTSPYQLKPSKTTITDTHSCNSNQNTLTTSTTSLDAFSCLALVDDGDPPCSLVPKRIRSSEVLPPSKKGPGTSLVKEVSPPSGIQPLLEFNGYSPKKPTRRIFKVARQKRESRISSGSVVEENCVSDQAEEAGFAMPPSVT
jgi:hypothetical protein